MLSFLALILLFYTDKSEFIRANQTLIISLFIYENMIFHYIRKN